ncbi:hypothetical protein KY362_07060, partial [Candidatus Woesearchaeota archaeon]|nr:hypothetical protein [Candidatus Woesearchaeota archaeon]
MDKDMIIAGAMGIGGVGLIFTLFIAFLGPTWGIILALALLILGGGGFFAAHSMGMIGGSRDPRAGLPGRGKRGLASEGKISPVVESSQKVIGIGDLLGRLLQKDREKIEKVDKEGGTRAELQAQATKSEDLHDIEKEVHEFEGALKELETNITASLESAREDYAQLKESKALDGVLAGSGEWSALHDLLEMNIQEYGPLRQETALLG